MTLRPSLALALSACIIITVPPAATAQERDTIGGRVALGLVAVIRTPTVIALGDTTRLAPTFGSIRATVESLGFALQVFTRRPVKQVVDQAHHAVHFVSTDLTLGYVIIVPGRRPVAMYGPVSPDSLRSHVLAYLRINRELETGGP